MRNTQFIPEKYKIKSIQSKNEYPIGRLYPVSDTPQVKKEIKRILGTQDDLSVYENKPLSGYHAMIDGSDILLFHPDGYGIHLTQYNIGIIIRECTITQGSIHDELIIGFDNTYREWVIIPYNKDTYKELKEQSDQFFKAKSGEQKLEYGALIDYNGTQFAFCGEYYALYFVSKLSLVKRYLIKGGYSGNYNICTAKVPDSINENTEIKYVPESEIFNKVIDKRDFGTITAFRSTGSYTQQNNDAACLGLYKEKPNLDNIKFTIDGAYNYDSKNYDWNSKFPLVEDELGDLYVVIDFFTDKIKYRFNLTNKPYPSKNYKQAEYAVKIESIDKLHELKIDNSRASTNNVVRINAVKHLKIKMEL